MGCFYVCLGDYHESDSDIEAFGEAIHELVSHKGVEVRQYRLCITPENNKLWIFFHHNQKNFIPNSFIKRECKDTLSYESVGDEFSEEMWHDLLGEMSYHVVVGTIESNFKKAECAEKHAMYSVKNKFSCTVFGASVGRGMVCYVWQTVLVRNVINITHERID